MWETNWDPGTWRIEILNFVGHFWMQVNWKITQFVKHKNTYRFNRGMVLEEILNRICQTRRITVRGGGRGIRGMKRTYFLMAFFISEFSVELLFSHCKRDFHWLLANYLFFLYSLFGFWLECLMKCPNINLIIARIIFLTTNQKFRSEVVLVNGKSVDSLVVCSVSLVPLLSHMQPSLINSNNCN